MTLKMLKAQNGDCFILNFRDCKNKNYNILIDGGQAGSYRKNLRNEVLQIYNRGENIDLLILTHCDDDHIGGLLKLFEDTTIDKGKIKKVFYNSHKILSTYFKTNYNVDEDINIVESSELHSTNQGRKFQTMIDRIEHNTEPITNETSTFLIGDAELIFLSPTISELQILNNKWEYEKYEDELKSSKKRDYDESLKDLQKKDTPVQNTLTNNSSISFVFKYKKKQILFLADSNPNTITDSLSSLGYTESNKIDLEYLKLSHHGSKYNTTYELLSLVNCSKFLISTSGTRHGHPDKETIAKILHYDNNAVFYCSHPIEIELFKNNESAQFGNSIRTRNEFKLEENL